MSANYQSRYTEDTLVQQTTAEYLEHHLGWESVYAHNNEDFGPASLLGRASDREVGAALHNGDLFYVDLDGGRDEYDLNPTRGSRSTGSVS